MQNTSARLIVALLVGATIALTGCEDDGGGSSPTVDVTGIWRGITLGASHSATLTLSQSGSSVSGTFVRNDGLSGTVPGSVSGNTFVGTASYSAGTVTFDATVSQNTMSGSYSVREGGSVVESGTFTGTRS